MEKFKCINLLSKKLPRIFLCAFKFLYALFKLLPFSLLFQLFIANIRQYEYTAYQTPSWLLQKYPLDFGRGVHYSHADLDTCFI